MQGVPSPFYGIHVRSVVLRRTGCPSQCHTTFFMGPTGHMTITADVDLALLHEYDIEHAHGEQNVLVVAAQPALTCSLVAATSGHAHMQYPVVTEQATRQWSCSSTTTIRTRFSDKRLSPHARWPVCHMDMDEDDIGQTVPTIPDPAVTEQYALQSSDASAPPHSSAHTSSSDAEGTSSDADPASIRAPNETARMHVGDITISCTTKSYHGSPPEGPHHGQGNCWRC